MTSGSPESTSQTNADGLPFPPWTIACHTQNGRKKWAGAEIIPACTSASLLGIAMTVYTSTSVWNIVGDGKEGGLPQKQNTGLPPPFFPSFLASSLIHPLFIFSRSTSLLRQMLVPFPFITHSFISSALICLYLKTRHLQGPLGTALKDEGKQNATGLISISGRRLRNRSCVQTGADSSSFIR